DLRGRLKKSYRGHAGPDNAPISYRVSLVMRSGRDTRPFLSDRCDPTRRLPFGHDDDDHSLLCRRLPNGLELDRYTGRPLPCVEGLEARSYRRFVSKLTLCGLQHHYRSRFLGWRMTASFQISSVRL